jgi:hypothetical protein
VDFALLLFFLISLPSKPHAQSSPSTTETVRILAGPESVGGIKLPAGSEIIEDYQGIVIEALLHEESHFGAATLPAATRILFFRPQIFLLIPATSQSANDWTTIPPGVLSLIDDGPDYDHDSTQCLDYPPWLTINGPANTQAAAVPLPSLTPLMMKDFTLEAPPAKPGLNTLSGGFHSTNFDLPQGTLVVGDDKAKQAIAIYAPGLVRMGSTILPSHSFIWLWPQFLTAYIHQPTAVNSRVIQPGAFFTVDGNGSLARFIAGDTTKINDRFVISAGSEIALVADRLVRVDLSKDTSYGGIPVAGGTTVCFLPDGAANLLLPSVTTIAGKTFPAGSTVVLTPDGGQVQYALLSKATVLDGFSITPLDSYQKVSFSSDGHFRSGNLSAPADVDGIHAKGTIRLYDDGSLQSGTLEGDQLIKGIPCLANKYVELNKAGEPIVFTAAGDYTIGATVLHRGDAFNRVYKKQDQITILPTQCSPKTECLADAIGKIEADLIAKLQAGIREHSSKIPFGNIGNIQSQSFNWNSASDHIDFHQDISVENMLTNPPFKDCDVRIHIDLTVKWAITKSFAKQWVAAWPASIGGNISHGVCPGTTAIEAVASVASAIFSHVREMLDNAVGNLRDRIQSTLNNSVVQKEIAATALAKYEPLLQILESNDKVIAGSIQIDRIFIDAQGLELSYEYMLRKE